VPANCRKGCVSAPRVGSNEFIGFHEKLKVLSKPKSNLTDLAAKYSRSTYYAIFDSTLILTFSQKSWIQIPRFVTSLLSRCDFQKYPTKVFRISFSVLRSQYAAVLQPEALVASVSRHSTGRFALSSEKITHFACISLKLPLSFSLSFLHFNLPFFCIVADWFSCI